MSNATEMYSQAYLDEFIGYRLTNTGIAFIIVETVLVALRFWSRHIQRAKLAWEDWLVIPALTFCIGNSILGFLAVEHGGVGRHVQYVSMYPEKLKYWYQTCLIATPVIYVIAAALPKVTILAVYLRIFVGKWLRAGCWVLLAIVVLNPIGNIPSLVYKCDPISQAWDPVPGGWCADVEPRLRYSSLFNIVSDLGLLILPIPLIWKLHTSKSTKLGLACVFATGSVGLVTSILRFIAFFSTEALTDGTWASVDLVQWCIIEPGVYLIAACLIAYRPLLLFAIKKTHLSGLLSRTAKTQKFTDGPTHRQYQRFGDRTDIDRNDLEMQSSAFQKTYPRSSGDSDDKTETDAFDGTYFAEGKDEPSEQQKVNGGSEGIKVQHEFSVSVDTKPTMLSSVSSS